MLNYRKKNIDDLNFGGCDLSNVCFWGVSAKSTNFKGAQMIDADCRVGDFSSTCFIDAKCKGVNFSGAFFNQTDFSGANLSRATFSSPSILTCIFTPETCFESAIYCHLGEENYWLVDILEEKINQSRFFSDSKNHYLKTA